MTVLTLCDKSIIFCFASLPSWGLLYKEGIEQTLSSIKRRPHSGRTSFFFGRKLRNHKSCPCCKNGRKIWWTIHLKTLVCLAEHEQCHEKRYFRISEEPSIYRLPRNACCLYKVDSLSLDMHIIFFILHCC